MPWVYRKVAHERPERRLELLDEQLDRLQRVVNGPFEIRGAKTVTATYTVLSTDWCLLCDATGAAFTVTLPDSRLVLGQVFQIKRMNGGANAVTVGTAAGNIDGAATFSLSAQYMCITVIAFRNGTTFGYAIV
jgi:hypothetical protein